ncbi:MAG TPA: glycosyltransferase family 39 protein, partial [Gaiellaceae bacterium]|nr:glycosyltransferase family 39 protein [Gaiellaceae bacterium]
MSRRVAYAAIAATCAAPRLVILLHERASITTSFTEKSDTIARMFVDHGTFGFVPGAPSAYTQPLYAWFLIPIYWVAGANWWSVGPAQVVVAVVTAWLVYEIGARVVSPRAGIVAAAIATLNPYLVWHDVHVNREIVDQVVLAGLVLCVLVAAARRSLPLAALAGALCGVSILGNSRLTALPLVLAAYLAWRLPARRALAAVAVARRSLAYVTLVGALCGLAI